MPVVSAILITVVVLAVWLAGLAVALRGMFRAIPVSGECRCRLRLRLAAYRRFCGCRHCCRNGRADRCSRLASGCCSPSASTSGHAAFADRHGPRRSADRVAVRQRWGWVNSGAGEEAHGRDRPECGTRPGEPPPKGEADRAPRGRWVPRPLTAPQTDAAGASSVTGAHDIVTAISAAAGGATVRR